jgi:hypothetical protein
MLSDAVRVVVAAREQPFQFLQARTDPALADCTQPCPHAEHIQRPCYASMRIIISRGLSCAMPCVWKRCGYAAGAYVYGILNANNCPAGSARIDMEGECQIAASVLQLTYKGLYYDRGSPKGCSRYYGTTAPGIYFNPHATGGGEPSSRPLCTTSTAPPTSPSPSLPGALIALLLVHGVLFRVQTPHSLAIARSCRP